MIWSTTWPHLVVMRGWYADEFGDPRQIIWGIPSEALLCRERVETGVLASRQLAGKGTVRANGMVNR